MTCDNWHVFESVLEEAFVKAFNSIYRDKRGFEKAKKEQMKDGSDLERLRARQMLELLKEPPLKCFVPEVAQLVLEEVTVFGREEFRFRFLDGTIKEV